MDFINTLKHTGDFVGVPFALRPWQEDIIRQIFDENGNARYRRVFIALPRKNGKTELIAAIALFLLLGTGKRGQNIYSASGDAEQAGLIHRAAATMIGQSEAMSGICQVYQGNVKRIKVDPLGSEFRSLSSEAYSKFGLRPSVNLFDEVHVFPNGDLHEALETAFGATKDPLTIYITTAGYDRTSLCWELWERARSAKRDPASDPNFLGILYEFEEGDDWADEAVWRKVNPGLGDYVGLKEFRDAFDNAQRQPRSENGFRQFRLNQWTQQAQRWLSVDAWTACGGKFDEAELLGQPCYAGFDGAVTGDMACFWMVFPTDNGVRVIGHGWVPREGRWRDEIRNKDRYPQWERDGFLTFTDKNTIDRKVIKRDIGKYNEKYPIRQLFADRAYSMDMLTDLFNDEGMDVKGITNSPLNLNESCVRLEEFVLSGKIEHGSNPVLNWNVANASLKRGSTGLIYPDRSSATERIDGLMALVYALAAYISDPESYSASVYEEHGIQYL